VTGPSDLTGPADATPAASFDVEIPEGRLRGEESGAGAAVVLIHGFSFDRSMWDPQVAALADRHRVIRYDLRGFGRSGAPAAGRGHVADLLVLLDALTIDRAQLVGLSLGANIALAAAAFHPDRVRRLVLASPGLPGHQWTTPRPPDEAAHVARREGVEAGKRYWLSHEIFRSAQAYPEAHRRLADMVERFPAHQWVEGPAAAPLPSLTGYLSTVRPPTLILNGAFDVPGYREIATILHREIPNAEHRELPDAGHLLNLERPAEFNAHLLRFLRP
jgi:3-oxoadipate enol-lactonase